MDDHPLPREIAPDDWGTWVDADFDPHAEMEYFGDSPEHVLVHAPRAWAVAVLGAHQVVPETNPYQSASVAHAMALARRRPGCLVAWWRGGCDWVVLPPSSDPGIALEQEPVTVWVEPLSTAYRAVWFAGGLYAVRCGSGVELATWPRGRLITTEDLRSTVGIPAESLATIFNDLGIGSAGSLDQSTRMAVRQMRRKGTISAEELMRLRIAVGGVMSALCAVLRLPEPDVRAKIESGMIPTEFALPKLLHEVAMRRQQEAGR